MERKEETIIQKTGKNIFMYVEINIYLFFNQNLNEWNKTETTIWGFLKNG